MVFLFIQKPLYLSSFPGSTDAKCGVQSIKPLLIRPDCPDPFHRIVGGCPVIPPHSWPWTIQLRVDKNRDGLFSQECGAALLSPLFALTASHCFL